MREARERQEAKLQKRDRKMTVVTDQLTGGGERDIVERDMEIDTIMRINNVKCRQLVGLTGIPRGRQLHKRHGKQTMKGTS